MKHLGLFAVVILAPLFCLWPLLVVGGLLALRLATGREAMRYAGHAAVEIEPLPAGVPALLEILRLEPAQREAMTGSHFLHELEITRRRVARKLAELTSERRAEEPSFFGDERIERVIKEAFAKLRALGVELPPAGGEPAA